MTMRPVTAVALAVVLAALAGAVADFRITVSRIPPLPAQCRVSTPKCENARIPELERWNDRIDELESGFRGREWIYGMVALAAALGWTAVSLRERGEPRERQRLFANLGVAGVVAIVVVSVFLWFADPSSIEPQARPAYLPGLAILAVAALGGLGARSRSGVPLEQAEREPQPAWRQSLRRASLAGFAFTAATFVLALIFSGQQPSCGDFDHPAPDWADYVMWTAIGTSIAAGVLGVFGLIVRRWFVALVCFVVNPVLLLVMVASTCAFE